MSGALNTDGHQLPNYLLLSGLAQLLVTSQH